MAVSVALLAEGSAGNVASFTTDSVSPAGGFVLLWETHGKSDDPTSVSGLGLSWSMVDSGVGNNAGGSLWVGTGVPSPGAVTVAYAATASGATWRLMDVSGSSGIVQHGSVDKGYDGQYVISVNLASPTGPTLGHVAYNSNGSITVGSGFTAVGTQVLAGGSTANGSRSEIGTAATVDFTFATAGAGALVAIELGEASVAPATGTASTSWAAVASAVGSAPAIPVATGTASTTWAASASAVGSAPAVPLNTGTASTTWSATATAVGEAPTVPVSEGTASTSWQAAASAVGSAPAVGLHEGTASLSWPAVASAVGSSPAVPMSTGEASTTWAATATAVGESPAVAMHSGTATTTWEASASATGEHPKPKRNLTLSDTAPLLEWSDTGPTRAWADGGPGADGWADEAPARVWSDQLLGR